MVTGTIKSLEYVVEAEQEYVTPLGEKHTETIPIDAFRVVFDAGSVTDHPLYFAPAALGNRIANYETVSEPIESVEALVRELLFSWSPSLEPADPNNRVDVNGGIDSRIEIKWESKAVVSKAERVLADFAEEIDEAANADPTT